MRVILVPAPTLDRNGDQKWFVEITDVPWSRGGTYTLVIGNAQLLPEAEKLREQVEDALHEYRRPKKKKKKKRSPKNVWQRLKAV